MDSSPWVRRVVAVVTAGVSEQNQPFRICLASLALCAALTSKSSSEPAAYDILIKGGRIVDGAGNPWYRGDLAVKGDRIVAVGRVPAGTAKVTINAKNLVVAPVKVDDTDAILSPNVVACSATATEVAVGDVTVSRPRPLLPRSAAVRSEMSCLRPALPPSPLRM